MSAYKIQTPENYPEESVQYYGYFIFVRDLLLLRGEGELRPSVLLLRAPTPPVSRYAPSPFICNIVYFKLTFLIPVLMTASVV